MFAIYDIEGRRFRDTLENLRKVREVQLSTETLLGSNSAEDETRAVTGTTGGEAGESVISGKAVRTYREMRHRNRREPIYHAHQLMSHPVNTVPLEMGILEASAR